jgi:hypothetical protein
MPADQNIKRPALAAGDAGYLAEVLDIGHYSGEKCRIMSKIAFMQRTRRTHFGWDWFS